MDCIAVKGEAYILACTFDALLGVPDRNVKLGGAYKIIGRLRFVSTYGPSKLVGAGGLGRISRPELCDIGHWRERISSTIK